MQKERKKVTLKRDKSILKEVTDYAVGQLEGNEWKYEEKYHCSDLRSSDLDNCGKKYRDENITVVANRENIEDREAFARELLQMYKDDSFHSTKFSTDHGYATSLDMYIYLWKEDIEEGESVMTAEYRPIEYGKDYDVVNNPDKFQLYIDGEEIE